MHPNSSKIQLYYIGNTFGDALPTPFDSNSLMLAEIGVDGWAAYVRDGSNAGTADTVTIYSTGHVAEGDRLTLVLACHAGDNDELLSNVAVHVAACGSASVTVLDGISAAPLGPTSEPVFPTSGEVSAPVDVGWSGSSGLSRGQSVALRIDLEGNIGVFSFTYSNSPLEQL